MLYLFICTYLLHKNIYSRIPVNLNIAQFDLLFTSVHKLYIPIYCVSLLQFNSSLDNTINTWFNEQETSHYIRMIYPSRTVKCIICVVYTPYPRNSQRIPTGKYISHFFLKKKRNSTIFVFLFFFFHLSCNSSPTFLPQIFT